MQKEGLGGKGEAKEEKEEEENGALGKKMEDEEVLKRNR